MNTNSLIMTSTKPYLVRAFYDWIVDNGATPYLLADATQDGVEVPRQYVNNGQIVLNLSPVAIHGLHMDNDWISFNARFAGTAMDVFVPLSAVLAIYARENGQGMAFQAEPQVAAPDGSHEADTAPVAQAPQPEAPPRPPKGKPTLTVVK